MTTYETVSAEGRVMLRGLATMGDALREAARVPGATARETTDEVAADREREANARDRANRFVETDPESFMTIEPPETKD